MDNQYNYYNPENSQSTYQNYSQPEHTGREKKQKKKMPKAAAVIGLALLFGVVSSATFLASNILGNKILGLENTSSPKSEARTATPMASSVSKSTSAVTSDVSAIVENVMPSVVSITNLSIQQIQDFFGGTQKYETQSAGTGIIIGQTDDELLIVTNHHVIQSSETLTVTFSDESSIEAHVKGSNPGHDVAVIAVQKNQVSEETMKNIAVATLGDSTQLKVGEPAIAIGNALGYGQSVTTGVISAVDRVIPTEQSSGEGEAQGISMIQTDAAINEGNSGGALLNINGEVIGINSAKIAGSKVEGVGYAIPISDVSDIIDGLMNQKTKYKVAEGSQGYLGITCFDVENAQKYHMPSGVYVYETVEGGPADRAGITKGNIITAVNGSGVDGKDALQKELTYYAVGETVNVTIQVPENNGEYTEKTVRVTLGELEQ
ncbi:MAG: trypsin-like serine protease [Ruminococcus sp.]|uniref:PDZ domain-containing protein n=1 Tax=Schaedlerella arabinosiphila TaxID=2044587 RepID=A0A3R8JQ34_9FIRM|nr:trypsin-like peptidase domain-containing protein [Schaedlerella arabinosiphila]MCI8723044.1 trypsin-like serine protease [Ruminococcus sp.]MCI9211675.1 trypsin-like serine protease [Ruminococcus sp.]MDE7066503.1 trypsin-like peptidase domain-containing protein [Schaedlerella arabinosiphila]RRK33284.1 PDZ domain-containing protein [Schaedlerella arabinosiphila]